MQSLEPGPSRLLRNAERGTALFFFAALFVLASGPVTDPDFWWHLATGRWIAQNAALPGTDPFSFHLGEWAPGPIEHLVLSQYWLAQLVLHAVHSAAGFHGVVLLRAAVVTALFFVLWLQCRRLAGAPVAFVLVHLAAAAIILDLGYIGDRPQLWSSLLAVVLVGLLDAARQGSRRAAWALPAVMLLWANLHGGYVLGDVLVALYLATALVFRFGHGRLYVAGAAALLASAVNPNGWRAFAWLAGFAGAPAAGVPLVEMQSLFTHASVGGILRSLPWLSAVLAASVALLAVGLAQFRKLRPEYVVIWIAGLLMGFVAIRFLVFTLCFAALFAAANAGPVVRRVRTRFSGPGPLARHGRIAAAAAAVALGLHLGWLGVAQTALADAKPYRADFEGAAEFVRAKGLSGPVFNDHSAGGYLLWALSPQVRVFTDGRGLDQTSLRLWSQASDDPWRPVSPGDSMPVYKAVLHAVRVNVVMVSGCDPASGVLVRLVPALLHDKDWAVVYADARALVFVRNAPALADFVATHRLPPAAAWRHVMMMAQEAARSPHGRRVPGWQLSLAMAYAGVGHRQEAREWVQAYLARVPGDPLARELAAELGGP